jgi:hypothetical protein
MSHSDAVSVGVQPNDVNTAIGNLTDSSDSRLEQFLQGFWLLGRDDAAADLALERPKSVEGKFCGIAGIGSDPTSAALLKGRKTFRGLSECRLRQESPQTKRRSERTLSFLNPVHWQPSPTGSGESRVLRTGFFPEAKGRKNPVIVQSTKDSSPILPADFSIPNQ